MRRPCVWRALRSSSSCLRCIPAPVSDMCGGPPPLWTSCPILFTHPSWCQPIIDLNHSNKSPRWSWPLIICCQPDQIITQCIRYSVRSRGSLALTRMSMSKHSFHFPESCSWRLKIEKIRIILQISSDPGVEVFLVQKPDMDLYRWYPRGSLNHNKVETNIFNQDATCKMNVNTHILQVSSPIWSWNVDVGLFLHMQTIVSLLIQVMCSEHSFLRTGSGGHSMWSSPSKQCRGWVPPPGQESGCLDPHCLLTPENWEQRKESMLRSIFVYLTSYQCHESSMASGFAGSKSLLRTHSELPSVKTSAKS